jgi:hypothetical protein
MLCVFISFILKAEDSKEWEEIKGVSLDTGK